MSSDTGDEAGARGGTLATSTHACLGGGAAAGGAASLHSMQRDRLEGASMLRGEVANKANAPGDAVWKEVRSKWLRKSAEFDLENEAKMRERKLKARAEEAQKNSRALSFDIIERHLSTNQPFPQQVPLPMLVSVLNEIWDEEGL